MLFYIFIRRSSVIVVNDQAMKYSKVQIITYKYTELCIVFRICFTTPCPGLSRYLPRLLFYGFLEGVLRIKDGIIEVKDTF